MFNLSLCETQTEAGICLKLQGHKGRHDEFPALWNEISDDLEDKTRKKIVKAGFATPRGGDKGGYQNHVSRSSRVIIPFEHSSKVDFANYSQGFVIRLTVPQYIEQEANGNIVDQIDNLQVSINGQLAPSFVLFRSQTDLEVFPPRDHWRPCWHEVNGSPSLRRNSGGIDLGHFLSRIPRGEKLGIAQGIFAPEYTDRLENYKCQQLLTFLAYKTSGKKVEKNFEHICEILDHFKLLNTPEMKLKGLLNTADVTACPLCERPIDFDELHEAIDPSQVPGLENSGVQFSETRSTLVNLFHLQPLLYAKTLGHTAKNIAWGHAHCNTFLAQRKSFSVSELASSRNLIDEDLFWDDSQLFIRSKDGRAWVSVTPLPGGKETFTDYLLSSGHGAAVSSDDTDD